MTRAHGGTRTNRRLTAQTLGEDSRLLGYDPRGNITAVLDSHHQLILGYDALGGAGVRSFLLPPLYFPANVARMK